MLLHRILLAGSVSLGLVLAGCPSSTTLESDGGGTGTDVGSAVDASGSDAPGSDAPGSDAFVAPDTGPHAAWDSCTQTSQCTLAPSGCCEPCGTPMLSDYDGVNATETAAHFMDVCPVPTPCPRCATGMNPNLVATCEASHCAARDISMLPLSACTSDADCIVRWANCCSCGGDPSQVVAIRADGEGAIEALLCDGGGCPLDCAPHGDPTFHAICEPTTGHCAAVPN